MKIDADANIKKKPTLDVLKRIKNYSLSVLIFWSNGQWLILNMMFYASTLSVLDF
jgi:hypothetical protein